MKILQNAKWLGRVIFFIILLFALNSQSQPGFSRLCVNVTDSSGKIISTYDNTEIYSYSTFSKSKKTNRFTLDCYKPSENRFCVKCIKFDSENDIGILIVQENDTMDVVLELKPFQDLLIDSLIFKKGRFTLKETSTARYENNLFKQTITGKKYISDAVSSIITLSNSTNFDDQLYQKYLKIKAINDSTSNEVISSLFNHTDYHKNIDPNTEHKWSNITKELFCGKLKNNIPWEGIIYLYKENNNIFINTNYIKPVKKGKVLKAKYIKPC